MQGETTLPALNGQRMATKGRHCHAKQCCLPGSPCWPLAPQASISVAGYPVGGDSLSITKGIVSRLALVRYRCVCSACPGRGPACHCGQMSVSLSMH
jgi:hypothetical protein